MNAALSEIKKLIQNNFEQKEPRALPFEEAQLFFNALKNIDKSLLHFDLSSLEIDKNDLKKFSYAYILIHDLFHQEIQENDLAKLEIYSTAPIFIYLENIIPLRDYKNLITSYLILGFSALKTNPFLENLISEKVILGEFVSIGGLERGFWGLKPKIEILPSVAKNILEKTEKEYHHLFVKKYKNFVFDFL